MLLATAVAALLALLYNTVVARALGRVDYAEFAAALAAANMLAYAGGALAPITAHLSARYLAAGEPEKILGLISTLIRRMLPILAAGGVAVLIGAAPVAAALHFASPVSIAAAYFVLAGLLTVSVVRSATRGAHQFGQFGLGVAGEALLRLVAGWLLLKAWPHPASALAAYVIALAATFAWTMRGLRRLAPAAKPVPGADVMTLLGTTTALVVAMAAFQNIDLLVVKRSFEPAAAGSYAAAWSFARWMALVAFPIEALLLPRLTFEGERQAAAAVAMRLGISMLALGAVPLAIFAWMPSRLITVLYGAEYRDAAPLLFFLGLGAFAQYASYLIAQALLTRAHNWAVVLFTVAGAIETAIIIARHGSLAIVAQTLVAARVATLGVLLIATRVTARRIEARHP